MENIYTVTGYMVHINLFLFSLITLFAGYGIRAFIIDVSNISKIKRKGNNERIKRKLSAELNSAQESRATLIRRIKGF